MAIRNEAHDTAAVAPARPRPPVAHATFCVERTYAATPAQAFHALTDGHDDVGSRERGTNFLLDALGCALER